MELDADESASGCTRLQEIKENKDARNVLLEANGFGQLEEIGLALGA